MACNCGCGTTNDDAKTRAELEQEKQDAERRLQEIERRLDELEPSTA